MRSINAEEATLNNPIPLDNQALFFGAVQDEITHVLDEAGAPDLWAAIQKKRSLSEIALYSLYNSNHRYEFKFHDPNVVLCGFLEVSILRVPNEDLRSLVFFQYDYESNRWVFTAENYDFQLIHAVDDQLEVKFPEERTFTPWDWITLSNYRSFFR